MAKNDLPDRGEGFGSPQQLDKMVDYAEGSVVSRTLVKNQAGTITLFSFATGQALSEHSAPYDAFVEILDGEAELTIGEEKVSAKTGDFVIMPANIPHAVFAPGPFKMLLVMIRG